MENGKKIDLVQKILKTVKIILKQQMEQASLQCERVLMSESYENKIYTKKVTKDAQNL